MGMLVKGEMATPMATRMMARAILRVSIRGLQSFRRLLKNGRLLRYPAASPSRRRGKESLPIRRDATLRISGAPAKRDFAELNLHLALFEQHQKDDFFSSLLDFDLHPFSQLVRC